jgi:hypothetical protein
MRDNAFARDDVIVRDDVIGRDEVIALDVLLYACNFWRMAGRIFIKFGTEVMTLKSLTSVHIMLPSVAV